MTDTTNITNTMETTQENLSAEQTVPPKITWDDIRLIRNDLLHQIEGKYRFDMPPALLKQFQDYKQALRDLPETYKDLEDLHQIKWPNPPMIHQNLVLSR